MACMTAVLSSYSCLALYLMSAISIANNLVATDHRQERVQQKSRSSDVNKALVFLPLSNRISRRLRPCTAFFKKSKWFWFFPKCNDIQIHKFRQIKKTVTSRKITYTLSYNLPPHKTFLCITHCYLEKFLQHPRTQVDMRAAMSFQIFRISNPILNVHHDWDFYKTNLIWVFLKKKIRLQNIFY